MQNHLRKTAILAPAVTAALVLMAPMVLSTGAFAINPTTTTRDGGLHFVGSPQLTVSKTDGATLTATGEVAGAGQGAGTATLAADVDATVGCINRGGGDPSGQERVRETVTATAPFEPTRQGRGTFTVTTEAITIDDFDFTCPDGMTEVLVGSITFSNIVLTISAQTGTITATYADQDP
jgi:hypothetical protein